MTIMQRLKLVKPAGISEEKMKKIKKITKKYKLITKINMHSLRILDSDFRQLTLEQVYEKDLLKKI